MVHFPLFMAFNYPCQAALGKVLHKFYEKGFTTITDEATGEKTELSYADETRRMMMENRDWLYNELKKIDVPWEPIMSEGGYFLLLNITKVVPMIPEKYFQTHDYEDPESGAPVGKYRFQMPDGRIANDQACARWLAVEYGVVTMPVCFFYPLDAKEKSDCFLRMGICKTRENIQAVVQRMKKIAEK